MSYLGNQPATGENNSFKILDDLTSYTQTFDGSSATVVSIADDTLTFSSHRFVTGQRVTYTHGGGTAIGGLTSGTAYFVIKNDQNTIKLASSLANANSSTAINLSALGTGTSHTLNVAFDGTNTKFVVTYDSGTKAQMTRAAQLQISINGVIQQPHDTATPATGFGISLDSVIVFSTAPLSTDVFWGNLVANNFPTFDIADNSVDTFTGNNSTTSFTLSKTPANNQNILVTLDGVVQYPSDAFTVRAYSVSENVLTFVGAPGNNVAIQVRHIGFAGATSSAVTGFYGRTGNVALTNQDHITVGSISSVGNINSSGIITATSFVGDGSSLTGIAVTANVRTNSLVVSGVSTLGNTVVGGGTTQLVVTGNARITGILTIGTSSITLDGSNNQVNVGTGVTINSSGVTVTGVITATSFSGAVTGNATGLSGTPNITVGNIIASSATISGNVSVAGTLTYEDVTNVDSVGLITARTGVRIDAGGLVVVGVTTVAAGSTAAPSISPTGDSNTGIFFPSADTIAFGEGGAEALRINSSGNIGIGTTNPTSKLQVQGTIGFGASDDTEAVFSGGRTKLTSSSSGFVINHNDNSATIFQNQGTERVHIDANGNLGINDTSPTTRGKFVVRNTDTRYFAVESSGLSIARYDDNGMIRHLSLANYGMTAAAHGASLGFELGNGNIFRGRANIKVLAEQTFSSTASTQDASMTFETILNSSSVEGMRLNSDGELLIGYTSDNGAFKLQVNSQIFATSATIATSDGRYKENVETLAGGYDIIKSLRPVSFTWKPQEDVKSVVTVKKEIYDENNIGIGYTDVQEEKIVREKHNFPSGVQVGFIAQEVREVLSDKPWLESIIKENIRKEVKDEDGNVIAPEENFYGIAEGNMIAILTSALKDAINEIETLKQRVSRRVEQ